MKYLSLCIPTNGIAEWVFPVLDRIYQEDVNHDLWEVVLTNNGSNQQFDVMMKEYASKQDNLIYKRTDAFMFENQIEALRSASGAYLKFLNHRSLVNKGTVEWMIETIKKYIDDKPVIYWANGALSFKDERTFENLDGFVKALGSVASWTTGVGVWKSDFERIPSDWKYNAISPHSDVLYWIKKDRTYKIMGAIWAKDIDISHVKKGNYDLFRAFAVEEIMIPLQLYIDGYICGKTLKSVISNYRKLVSGFYCLFVLLKEPCSYDISGFDSAMGIFMKKRSVLARAVIMIPKYLIVQHRINYKKQ